MARDPGKLGGTPPGLLGEHRARAGSPLAMSMRPSLFCAYPSWPGVVAGVPTAVGTRLYWLGLAVSEVQRDPVPHDAEPRSPGAGIQCNRHPSPDRKSGV